MSALQERLREAQASRRAHQPVRWRHLPGRYAAIAVGSALLLVAAVAGVPAGPAREQPLAGVVAAVASALALAALALAALPHAPRAFVRFGECYARWAWARLAALALAIALALGTAATFAGGALFALGRPPAEGYTTDILAFSAVNGRLALAGRNPYTSDDAFWSALRKYPNAMVTPLQRGRFASSPDFPDVARLYEAQREAATHPDLPYPEFDPRTLHSYPALSFLVYVPLIAAGIDNILWLHVLVYWALFAWLVWLAPPRWRGWSALIAGTALTTVGGSLFTANEVIAIAFILTAWRYRRAVWLSAALLGLGCAFKQYVWFFTPIFLAEALARRGWTDALRRGLIALGAFLAPNLPFIIASPRAWWESLWLPMSSGLFREGVGVVALSMDHALPYAPPWFYSALEMATLAGVTLLVWRRAASLGEATPLLALVPLFFAGRAFASYFAFAPWLALYTVGALEGSGVAALVGRGGWTQARAAVEREQQGEGQNKERHHRRDNGDGGGITTVGAVANQREQTETERDGQPAVGRNDVGAHGACLSTALLGLRARRDHNSGDEEQRDDHTRRDLQIADDQPGNGETSPLHVPIRLVDLIEREMPQDHAHQPDAKQRADEAGDGHTACRPGGRVACPGGGIGLLVARRVGRLLVARRRWIRGLSLLLIRIVALRWGALPSGVRLVGRLAGRARRRWRIARIITVGRRIAHRLDSSAPSIAGCLALSTFLAAALPRV